jgi:hypothetical protein
MQHEVNEFMEYVKHELARGIDDWEQRLSTALVKSSPTRPRARGARAQRPPGSPAGRRDPEEAARTRSSWRRRRSATR